MVLPRKAALTSRKSLPSLRKRGIRFSKAISLGNEANIDIVDALEYLGEDEQTKGDHSLYRRNYEMDKRFIEVARKVTPAQTCSGTICRRLRLRRPSRNQAIPALWLALIFFITAS